MSGKRQKRTVAVWEDFDMADTGYVQSDNPDDWVRVGSFITQRRSELGMTQGEAAELANLSTPTWQLIERGRRQRLRRMNVPGIERALGWALGSLEALLLDNIEPELIASAAEELNDSYGVTELRRSVMELEERVGGLEDLLVDVIKTLRSVPKL